MKALTVRQPWAWAIAAGAKTVENRTRGTKYRGPLAIHAGAGWSDRGAGSPLIRDDWARLVAEHPNTVTAALVAEPVFVRGAVIAVAQLVDSHVATVGRLSGEALCCDDPYAEAEVYREDEREPWRAVVHLVLADVVALDEPVKCRGMLGFWSLSADVEDVVAAELAAAVA